MHNKRCVRTVVHDHFVSYHALLENIEPAVGCFRTSKGADDFVTVRSYTATAQKQGHNVFSALIFATQRTPINLAQA